MSWPNIQNIGRYLIYILNNLNPNVFRRLSTELLTLSNILNISKFILSIFFSRFHFNLMRVVCWSYTLLRTCHRRFTLIIIIIIIPYSRARRRSSLIIAFFFFFLKPRKDDYNTHTRREQKFTYDCCGYKINCIAFSQIKCLYTLVYSIIWL